MNAKRAGSPLRAFTLVELMVVVIIVGVLAAIGIASFRERIFGSKSSEALAMIQSIRAAQERYRAGSLAYLDVSREGWYPADPVAGTKRSFYKTGICTPGEDKDDCRWKLLNPTIVGPVHFAYRVNAGLTGETMTAPVVTVPGWADWPAAEDPWFVIQAIGDMDGDGEKAFFIASNLRADVFVQNDGE